MDPIDREQSARLRRLQRTDPELWLAAPSRVKEPT
jgi:hypothetical protein